MSTSALSCRDSCPACVQKRRAADALFVCACSFALEVGAFCPRPSCSIYRRAKHKTHRRTLLSPCSHDQFGRVTTARVSSPIDRAISVASHMQHNIGVCLGVSTRLDAPFPLLETTNLDSKIGYNFSFAKLSKVCLPT